MARKSFERILIIQTAFLGDVILATGLVEKVYQHYPDAEIDILIRKGYESLFEGHPGICRVHVFQKNRQKYLNLLRLVRVIRGLRYDVVVNVQRFFSSGLITFLAGADISVGFNKNPLSFLFSNKINHQFDGNHETGRNHNLVAWFTDDQPGKPVLYPQPRNYENVAVYSREKYFCIAPASIWATKQFPEQKWLEFLSMVPDGISIYLIGGDSDHPLGEKIRTKAGRECVINLCGKLSLLDTAALMAGAALNLVNDSAPMHMASAMNAPVCAVYCSTIPAFGYGPLSDQSYILEINGELYCRPCGIHGRKKCPEGHFRCALDITQEQMKEILNKVV
jgi:lipopolysaccharide heptosyltransferase II